MITVCALRGKLMHQALIALRLPASETVSALSNDAHQTGEIPSLSLSHVWCAF